MQDAAALTLTGSGSAISIGAPFVATGVFKSLYLLGFYLLFRGVRPPEEQARAERAALLAAGREDGG